MVNRFIFNCIVSFVCGILFGYAAHAFYNEQSNKKRKHNKDEDSYLELSNVSKEHLENEINRLYSLLDVINQKESVENNTNLRPFNNSNDNDQDNFDNQSDLNDYDSLDRNTELFYDTSEIFSDQETFIVNTGDIFESIDAMFDNNSINKQFIYTYLKQKYSMYSNDANFLWRLSKAAHFLSKTAKYQLKENDSFKKKLLFESFDYADQALTLDDKNANCHKWYAISIGCLSDYVSIKEKISNGIKFQQHLEIAMKLKEDDPTLYYLAARFCLEILSVSWTERKLASIILGGNLPTVTIDDALQYFHKAYLLKPNWKENIFYYGQTLLKNKDKQRALELINEGLSLPNFDEEQSFHESLLKLKNSI